MTDKPGPPAPPQPIATASPRTYAVALLVTVVAILSQYFVPQMFPPARAVYGTLLGGLLIVYGVPVLIFTFLVGARPLRAAFRHLGTATEAGVRWAGLLLLLSLLVVGVLITLYARFDPSAIHFLSRPNPALQEAAPDPYFWIAFAFVIGAVEETIFRGWVFGYWLQRDPRRWWLHAFWTSALFAGVHLYYGTTYGPIAPVQFTTLFLLGFAYAGTMRSSGGNLVVIAVLHGANDASAFSTLITPVGADLYFLTLIVGGLVLGLIAIIQSTRAPATNLSPFVPPGPYRPELPAAAPSPYPWAYPPPPPSEPPPHATPERSPPGTPPSNG
ncbi:MAG: CPBP family intramembrane metalloprotease [Thermoplasmata archaeon]|nr:CPBP family intramembrane metalloprotease [Thermoplasmata archaeon]